MKHQDAIRVPKQLKDPVETDIYLVVFFIWVLSS